MTAVPTAGSFCELLEMALQAVDADVPEARTPMSEALGARVVEIVVDTERFWLASIGVRTNGGSDGAPSSATVRTTSAQLCRLLDGHDTIVSQVDDGGLQLQGAALDLAAVDRALRTLIHGLIRSPAAPALMQTVRDLAKERTTKGSSEEER